MLAIYIITKVLLEILSNLSIDILLAIYYNVDTIKQEINTKGGNDMKELSPVIKAMLKDEEFMIGGIFSKEKYYAEKYDLTEKQIANIQTCLYFALHIRDEYYNNIISNI